MDLNAYATLANQYQAPAPEGVPVKAVPMNPALDIMRHLRADSEQQQKEPIRPLHPITPVAS